MIKINFISFPLLHYKANNNFKSHVIFVAYVIFLINNTNLVYKDFIWVRIQ